MGLANRLAVTALLLLGTTPVFAADLDVRSAIDAVAVYPDGATVSRVIDFSAPPGETTLVARDLPPGIDASSLRVDAGEADGVAIAGIDASTATIDVPQPDASAGKALVDLHDRRDAVAATIAALTAKQALIERFARTSGFPTGKDGGDAASLRATWNAVGDDLTGVNEAIRQAKVTLRGVDEQIADLERRRDGRPQGRQGTALRIALSSDRPARGRLHVSYLVAQAGWTPLYDARLDTGRNALEVIRRARVTQSTGEDWRDVTLTISTAHASTGASVPKLDSRIVAFAPDILADAVVPAPRAEARKSEAASAPIAPSLAARPAPPPVPGRETEARTDIAGFQSTWTLPGRTSIQSGPSTRSLRLASFTVSPEVVARAAPALQEAAYIEAAFDLADDTPLFPGSVSIYRDGLYAGQADMPFATSGQPVRLGFGVDDRIKIDRVVTRKLESDSGNAHPTSSDRRDYKVTLRNGRPTPIRISVEEALPVSENSAIRIELSPQMTPPTVKNADDRRGVAVWTYDLAPGEVKDIRFGYRVTWPWGESITLD
ncbi:mucoidy inhibitor MuiA family protein [Labrys monachus]|uniref:Uncharacterized protein (TIGR02231 family) n=1 Tax=Labrys monachus TaxID=217067 RepID=A0ABU0FAQ2_9HYPH|nr:mucoidy inhibitor MuiA family protein [Labrys monachus]MDQ0391199.1 uncharacterized protein (TIGR02231 family) [Labrys monachus]